MPLLRGGALADDPWTRVGDDEPLPDGPAIVSLRRWLAERDRLAERDGPLGLALASDEAPEALAGDLDRFATIRLEFPAFTDGRAYSQARKLRQRYGFVGELRAAGEVLRDQYAFMRRCGIDAVEVADDADPRAWLAAANEIGVTYQAAADGRATVARRHR